MRKSEQSYYVASAKLRALKRNRHLGFCLLTVGLVSFSPLVFSLFLVSFLLHLLFFPFLSLSPRFLRLSDTTRDDLTTISGWTTHSNLTKSKTTLPRVTRRMRLTMTISTQCPTSNQRAWSHIQFTLVHRRVGYTWFPAPQHCVPNFDPRFFRSACRPFS